MALPPEMLLFTGFVVKYYNANIVIFSPRCRAGTSFLKRMQNLIERGDCYAPEMDLLLQASLFLRQSRHYAISTLITGFQSFETLFRFRQEELRLKIK